MFLDPVHMQSPPSKPRAFIARDPRVLLAAFAALFVSGFVIPTAAGLAVVTLYVILLHRLAGLRARSLLVHARTLAAFFVIVVGINGVLVEGEPIAPSVEWFSREGLMSGIHAGFRVIVLYLGAAVFLAVTPAEEIAKGVAAALAPVSRDLSREAALYAFLSAGFLPLFGDEIRRVSVAQEFRGGGFNGGIAKKVRGIRLLVVPLILSAIHRSSHLALAVELREIRRNLSGVLVLEGIRRRDYPFLVVTAAVIAVAWGLF
jgi:energy-coupling factor transporter transmembrane protein EcfT